MDQALTLQPRADANRMEEIDGPLLEHPSAHTLLDVGPVAALQHH
jgi:hypothetical protein